MIALLALFYVAAGLVVAVLLCRRMAVRARYERIWRMIEARRGAGENADRTQREAPTGHGTCTPVLTDAMRLAVYRRRNQEAAARRCPPFGNVWDAESWR